MDKLKMNRQIIDRYFDALEMLIGAGKVESKSDFCARYDIDRANFLRNRRLPGSKFPLFLLTVLVADYNVSANWLLTGRGKVFQQ
jgi:hypothetical protein